MQNERERERNKVNDNNRTMGNMSNTVRERKRKRIESKEGERN